MPRVQHPPCSQPPPVRLWSLASGSQGNAALVEWGDHRLLVDAGYDLPELVARIRAAGVAPATVDEVVLTHGHRDHVRGAADGARVYGWRLWGTLGTVWRWRALREVPLAGFAPGESFRAPPFSVHTAPTPHDIDDSSAVVVELPAAGVRIGYCTDLGEATPSVRALLRDLDALVVEANHDPTMLANGPYPPEVRDRVAGPVGHLSNAQAAELVRQVASPRLRYVVLAHVSRHNNDPALARVEVERALRETGSAPELLVAPQDAVLGPLVLPAREPHDSPSSLARPPATLPR